MDLRTLLRGPVGRAISSWRARPGLSSARLTSRSLVRSLRGRVLAAFLIAILPPIVATGIIADEWRRHEIADAQNYAVELVRRATAIYDREMQMSREILASVAPIAAAMPDQRDELGTLLRATLRHETTYENIGVFHADGSLVLSAKPLPDAAIASRPFFRQAVESGMMTMDDSDLQRPSEPQTVTIAYPIADRGGRPHHVVVSVMDMVWLREFASETLLPAGTIVFATDDRGTVVALGAGAGGVLPASAGEFVRSAASRTEIGTLQTGVLDGASRIVAFGPLGSAAGPRQMHVVIGIPISTATAQADAILAANRVAFAVSIALALLLGFVGTEVTVGRPVRALAAAAQRLKNGDMGARVGGRSGPGELAQLAEAFDAMADALQARDVEITRQRDELANQEQRFRALIENSAEGISLRDQAGKLLYLSPSAKRILGFTPEELVGRDSHDFIHPDDREHVRGCLAHALAAPGQVISAVFRLRHKDGSYRWIASNIRNMLDDRSVGAVVGNYRDITEWVQSQDALLRAHDMLEMRVRERTAQLQKVSRIVEQTADSVFVTDRKGTIEYVNPAFEQLTGYTTAEAIDATPRIFSSGLHDSKFFAHLWETITAGKVFRAIVKNRHKSGRLYDEDQTITPIRDADGAITHFVSTGRDVTQRRRMQEALRRLNAMLENETTRIASLLHDEAGQFLSAAYIAIADIARDASPEMRVRLEDVRGHLDHVERQLRALSHDLHPRILRDLGLVGSIRSRAQAFTKRTGIAVTIAAPCDCLCDVPSQVVVFRLVQEALTNVLKHAGASRVTITLGCQGTTLTCSVQDNGVGFDPTAVLAREGEPSLGLCCMQDRVEAVGGTFEIISSPGAGTEIRASLPTEC